MTIFGSWKDVNHLPKPNKPLLVILADDGETNVIKHAKLNSELSYVDSHSIPLYTVIQWRYL